MAKNKKVIDSLIYCFNPFNKVSHIRTILKKQNKYRFVSWMHDFAQISNLE